jgi:hypothetical protein
MVSYTVEDFTSIGFSNSQFVLSPEILAVITRLTSELNTSEITSNSSQKTGSGKSLQKVPRNNRSAMDTTWEKTKVFKTTTIEKKEGVERNMNDVRICLNKLSESNYDITKSSIFTILRDLSDDALEKVAEMIFDIASTNQYFSELYAVLYKELNQEFPIFLTIFPEMIKTRYLDQFDNIVSVDMQDNFDLYCDNQKLNDKRKALSAFLVNLMKTDVYDVQSMLTILNDIIERVNKLKNIPDKLFEIEQFTENIFIIVTNITENAGYGIKEKEKEAEDKKSKKSKGNKKDETATIKPREVSESIIHVFNTSKYNRSELFNMEEWKTIVERLQACSKFVTKDNVSISSRVVFRYMDIMDNIKKNGGL